MLLWWYCAPSTEYAELFAQSATIRGKVQDKQSGVLLPGTIISLVPSEEVPRTEFLYAFQGARASLSLLAGENTKDQRNGAVAGRDGSYKITNIKPGSYVLTARYIGYKKALQKLRIEADTTLEIAQELVPDLQDLEQIVVTGVVSRTAKEVAEVSVGRVDMSVLTDNVRFSDPLQALIAKVPGLFMQFSNGNLASGVRINIRSSASLLGGQPVIFIDGVRSTGVDYQYYESIQYDEVSPLSTLAPNDIETVEVLKGPVASSLYGTSGQNGVILITTKRGKTAPSNSTEANNNTFDNALRINYRFSGGWQEPHRFYREDYTLNAANVNRIFRTGAMFQHTFNLQGNIGTAINYFASFNSRSEQGILPGSALAQYSTRFNVDVQPIPGFLAKFSAFFSQNTFDVPLQNENGGVFLGWIRNMLIGDPYSGQRFFSVDSLSIASIQNNITVAHLLGSADISYAPAWLPGLKIRALAGVEHVSSRAITYLPPGVPYSVAPNAPPSEGSRFIKVFTPTRLNYDANISYTATIGEDFTLTGIAGVQAYDNRFLLDQLRASSFPSAGIPAIQTGLREASVAELNEQYREAGIFARVETDYKKTLFVSGGVRNDYASTLGEKTPAIFYPQGSFALRVDKLGILPNEWNLFKFRGGYGESGKLPTLRQSSTLWKSFNAPGTSLTGSTGRRIFFETPIGNDSIRPERIQDIEFGADIEVQNRFGAELTGFVQFANDAILDGNKAPSTGEATNAQNTGRTRSWGAEAQLYGSVLNTENAVLRLNLLAGYADNIVDSLGSGTTNFRERSFYAGSGLLGNSNYIEKGQRRGVFMDRPVLAPRFQASGYYDWARGPVRDSVLRALGSSVPLVTGSFSWTLTLFRDVTFYGLIDAGFGRYIFNGTREQTSSSGGNPRFNRLLTQLGLAQGQIADAQLGIRAADGVQVLAPNTPEYQAAATEFMRMDTRFGDVANYLENGDWVRLRELSVRWDARHTLQKAALLPEHIRTFTLGVSIRNAFLWTNYSGVETEMNSPANIPSRSFAQSSDIFAVMQARMVNFGVEIGF